MPTELLNSYVFSGLMMPYHDLLLSPAATITAGTDTQVVIFFVKLTLQAKPLVTVKSPVAYVASP